MSQLVDVARRREKAVVFCGRIATVSAFRRALHLRFREIMERERKRWDRVRNRMRLAYRKGRGLLDPEDVSRLRLAAHYFGEVEPGQETGALRKLRRLLASSGEPGEESSRESLWREAWGPRRHVDWVGVLAGQSGHGEKARSPEAIQFAFNLPGPPYILLCTKIAREGIDLHLWCRRIVQFDLECRRCLR